LGLEWRIGGGPHHFAEALCPLFSLFLLSFLRPHLGIAERHLTAAMAG
jgi:hypothetical protein